MERLLTLFRERDFPTFIQELNNMVPEDGDPFDMFVMDIFKEVNEEHILEFFRYIEVNSTFIPRNVITLNLDSGICTGIVNDRRLNSNNYEEQWYNPAMVLDSIRNAELYDTADKLFVGEYALDEHTIDMYHFMCCDFSSDADDLEGIRQAKTMAQWLVRRGDLTWQELPKRLRPDFTGEFVSVGLLGDFIPPHSSESNN
jgi:hypothetical protein